MKFGWPKWWPEGEAIHEDFKIISNGRDLPFPMLRLLSIMAMCFVLGYGLCLVDVYVELSKRVGQCVRIDR